ncbi:MAG: hypothetical protein ACTIJ8_04360 [Sphingobacterium sp.]
MNIPLPELPTALPMRYYAQTPNNRWNRNQYRSFGRAAPEGYPFAPEGAAY